MCYKHKHNFVKIRIFKIFPEYKPNLSCWNIPTLRNIISVSISVYSF